MYMEKGLRNQHNIDYKNLKVVETQYKYDQPHSLNIIKASKYYGIFFALLTWYFLRRTAYINFIVEIDVYFAMVLVTWLFLKPLILNGKITAFASIGEMGKIKKMLYTISFALLYASVTRISMVVILLMLNQNLEFVFKVWNFLKHWEMLIAIFAYYSFLFYTLLYKNRNLTIVEFTRMNRETVPAEDLEPEAKKIERIEEENRKIAKLLLQEEVAINPEKKVDPQKEREYKKYNEPLFPEIYEDSYKEEILKRKMGILNKGKEESQKKIENNIEDNDCVNKVKKVVRRGRY